MALHWETTFKKTGSQYLTDHPALHGQPCAMRPTSLGRRHGKGLGRKRQKCWKASYRISAMLISKSMSEAESQPTSYKHIMIFMFFPELWFFTIVLNARIVSEFAWKCSLVEADLSWSIYITTSFGYVQSFRCATGQKNIRSCTFKVDKKPNKEIQHNVQPQHKFCGVSPWCA